MAKLAIIFPGIGYTCDKPLLYYAEDLAAQSGYECKRIAYALPGETRIGGNLEMMDLKRRGCDQGKEGAQHITILRS